MSAADYDIGQVMDALAATFNALATGDQVGGVAVTLECHAEVTGQIDPPSLVLELDDQEWDLNMGHGADSLRIVALALIQHQDSESSQRALWSFLSRKTGSGMLRLKTALEANSTLGGLVSYALLTGVRNIGLHTYNGINYVGAELIIEVMS